MIRAFLGLDLPELIRRALSVPQFLLPLPRRVDPGLMHLSLVFLGEVTDHGLEAAHESFAAFRTVAFPLTLQGLGLFGGDRPRAAYAAVAPSAPLTHLQAKAERAARAAGLHPEHSDLPMIATARGLPYVDLIGIIVRSAARRRGEIPPLRAELLHADPDPA